MNAQYALEWKYDCEETQWMRWSMYRTLGKARKAREESVQDDKSRPLEWPKTYRIVKITQEVVE